MVLSLLLCLLLHALTARAHCCHCCTSSFASPALLALPLLLPYIWAAVPLLRWIGEADAARLAEPAIR